MSDITAAALKEYLAWREKTGYQGQALWVSVRGTAVTKNMMQDIFEKIGKRCGLQFRLSSHKLRHTYATLCLKYGLNMEYLKRTMGHEDIETTSNAYLNVADADVASAYKKASPVSHIFQTSMSAFSEQQSGTPPAPAGQTTYQETAHKHIIRELARQLANSINVPSLWDKDLLRDLPVSFSSVNITCQSVRSK